jgi:type IV pilus assembly protein PilO
MTIGGDFIPGGDDNLNEAPSYPTLFGIQLTPTVSGVLIALLGLAGAGWLLLNVVQPTWQRTMELNQAVAEKKSQLINQEETQRQIQAERQKLEESKKLQADVLTLFADEQNLDTLLLDINQRVQSGNAELVKFEAATVDPEVITDSSLGPDVNNVLQRQVYDISMKGTFAQTQSIMRGIERLKPLLVVQDLRSELDPETRAIQLDGQGRLLATQPTPELVTSFKLLALLPAPDQPAPAPAASPGASPAASPEATTAPPTVSPAPTVSP